MKNLEKLADVVEFTISTSGLDICITECYEHYFFEDLSKAEFGSLISELKQLHSRMKDRE